MAAKRHYTSMEEENEKTPTKRLREIPILYTSIKQEMSINIKKKYIRLHMNKKQKQFQLQKFATHNTYQGASNGTNLMGKKIAIVQVKQPSESHHEAYIMQSGKDNTETEWNHLHDILVQQKSQVNLLLLNAKNDKDLEKKKVYVLLHEIRELNRLINPQFEEHVLCRTLRLKCAACGGINIAYYEMDGNKMKDIIYRSPNTKKPDAGKLFDRIKILDNKLQEMKCQQFIMNWNKKNDLRLQCQSIVMSYKLDIALTALDPLGISLKCGKCYCTVMNLYRPVDRVPSKFPIHNDTINFDTFKNAASGKDDEIIANDYLNNMSNLSGGTDKQSDSINEVKTTDAEIIQDLSWLNKDTKQDNDKTDNLMELKKDIAKSIKELEDMQKAIRLSAEEYKKITREQIKEEEDLKLAINASMTQNCKKYEMYQQLEQKQRELIKTLPEKERPGTSKLAFCKQDKEIPDKQVITIDIAEADDNTDTKQKFDTRRKSARTRSRTKSSKISQYKGK